MAFGKVKWFDEERGFGFIAPEDGGKDLFAHYSEIQAAGLRSLSGGQAVEFVVKHGAKGLHATAIRIATRSTASGQEQPSQSASKAGFASGKPVTA